MVRREDVRFSAEGGIELSAWLFIPAEDGPLPAITMAHGYAGTKYHGIEPFAEAFAEAGFAVLVHDHRGFGDSGGEPRQDRSEVDEDRVGLWGTSFAGGHAIVLGATDRRLKAVVAQVPTTDGHAAGLRRVAPDASADLEASFDADERAQLRGTPPATQAIVDAKGAPASTYAAADAVSFYLQPVPDGVWENKVTLRSTRWARLYAPGEFASRVSPTPLLMVVADRDTTSLTDLALAAYERALEPKRLVMIKGGHFDPYRDAFAAAAGEAIDWFTAHL
jgi:uncharacterized protein